MELAGQEESQGLSSESGSSRQAIPNNVSRSGRVCLGTDSASIIDSL